MGTSYSTPTIRPKDLDRWNRQGRPVLIDECRRARSPGGGRRHVETRRRYTRGDPFGGFALNGGGRRPIHPTAGNGFGTTPPWPGVYPNPLGGPDVVVGGGFGASYTDGIPVFDRPIVVERMPVFFERPRLVVEEADLDLFPGGSRFGRQDEDIHLRQPPRFMFVSPDDDDGDDHDLPPRWAHRPPPGFRFAGNTFQPRRDGRFDGGGYGGHRSTGFGTSPSRFSSDIPDDTSLESWGPVRGGRSPSPGFIFAEDGVPLRGRTSRNS
ncbi:hypothetical protein CLCR_08996 [Cladophialophora carrionii]|uniref:Uncharacterized protein n=1 Tax=Cladophialophora carrionii TaxID=86049 RepID=A0A1C1CTJ2_9EURO|nr:hypothetical protein CLCR_08996 [Cladophialophora carrionii]